MPLDASSAVPRKRLRALDGLRGLAMLLVFLFHYGGGLRSRHLAVRALGYLSQAGWVGLDVFFALSGFLITGLLLENLPHPGALRHFYARRALRILPLYWTALLAAGLAALLKGASLSQLRPLLVYAAFLQNVGTLVRAATRSPPPLPLYHLWSLAVEEQFYLLWSALMLLARSPRRVLTLCSGVFALSCAFRVAVYSDLWGASFGTQQIATSLPAHAGALAAGGSLAALHYGHYTAKLQKMVWPFFYSLTALLLAGGYRAGSVLFNDAVGMVVFLPAVHLLAATLVWLCLCPGRIRRIMERTVWVSLGRISYGFYVLHILFQPFFDQLAELATHRSSGFAYQAARLLLAFPLTVLGALVSYQWLERPFLRWKQRFPPSHIQGGAGPQT